MEVFIVTKGDWRMGDYQIVGPCSSEERAAAVAKACDGQVERYMMDAAFDDHEFAPLFECWTDRRGNVIREQVTRVAYLPKGANGHASGWLSRLLFRKIYACSRVSSEDARRIAAAQCSRDASTQAAEPSQSQ